jgi:FtsZ-interacting cell division protein ZipA
MTALLIILIVLAVVGLAFAGARVAKQRRIERERTRERIAGEAEGHRDQVVANRTTAQDVLAESGQRDAAAAQLAAEADRLEAEAARARSAAADEAQEAEDLRARGERAHTAAGRHEERLTDAEKRLENL